MHIKYKIEIEWCTQDEIYIASVPELGYCKTHSSNLNDLFANLEEAVKNHIEVMELEGQQIPAPQCELQQAS